MNLREQIESYTPFDEQEEKDIMKMLAEDEDEKMRRGKGSK